MIQLLAYLITVTIKFVPDHVLVTGCHVNAVEVRRPGRVDLLLGYVHSGCKGD